LRKRGNTLKVRFRRGTGRSVTHEEKKEEEKKHPAPRGRTRGKGYPLSLRRKAVLLHLEEIFRVAH
jgi:hypothetical protein